MRRAKITRQQVLEFASRNTKFKTADLVSYLRHTVSRQHVSAFLNSMVVKNELVKEGTRRNAFYALPQNLHALGVSIKKRYENKNLQEHGIADELRSDFPAIYAVPENVRSIFDYAFSEMLNNAINHSYSKYITVFINKTSDKLYFEVRDTGIGVFNSVMKKRNLTSPLEAIQDLLKGKTTTRPEAHSGEGIFFTSKTADVFILEGDNTRLRIDNTIPDLFIEEIKPAVSGTTVRFQISTHSKKHLKNVFDKYTTDGEKPDFDKTEVLIRLFTTGTIYVSRSQARRVLEGLEKFKKITLDFDRVPTIGQAFADEIFRVFQRKHPEIEIESINAPDAVSFMIKRAKG